MPSFDFVEGRDEREDLSHLACQKFAHTNFTVFLIKNYKVGKLCDKLEFKENYNFILAESNIPLILPLTYKLGIRI